MSAARKRASRPCWRSDCTDTSVHDHKITVEEAWRVIERMAGLSEAETGTSNGAEHWEELAAANDHYDSIGLSPEATHGLEDIETGTSPRCFLCRDYGHTAKDHKRGSDHGAHTMRPRDAT